jgi:hypothetical protein
MQQQPKRPTSKLTVGDWTLIAIIIGLLGCSVLCLLFTPTWWGWCLVVSDLRNWNHLTWTGVVIALLVSLWLVHICAKKKIDKLPNWDQVTQALREE